MANNTIIVEIECKQVNHYIQIVEMSVSDYEKLIEYDGDDITERREQQAYELIQKYINYDEVTDCDKEFTDFSINISKNF